MFQTALRNFTRMDDEVKLMDARSMLEEETRYFDEKYRQVDIFTASNLKIDIDEFLKRQTYVFDGGDERGHALGFAFDLIRRKGVKGKVICDYACGTGMYGVLLALLGAEVYGFDISAEGVRVSNQRAKVNGCENNAHFQVMSADNLRYEDEMFDYVFGPEALHHTIKYEKTDEELYRILKKGGKAIFRESLGHNPFIELFRKITLFLNDADEAGETNLTYDEMFRFGSNFNYVRIYEMSLIFMAKRFFRGRFDRPGVKPLLKTMKQLDDFLVGRFPSLKKFCGEVVIEYIK